MNYKRCIICDVSSTSDFQGETLGIYKHPPEYWVKTQDGEDICGRCNDEIQETYAELEAEEGEAVESLSVLEGEETEPNPVPGQS